MDVSVCQRIRVNPGHHPPFEVFDPTAFGPLFACVNDGGLAAVAGGALVVVVGNEAEPDLVPKGDAAVGVQQVRPVAINKLPDAVEPHPLPARVLAVPTGIVRLGGEVVEVLIRGIGAIVRHAGQGPGFIRALAALEPGVAGPEVSETPTSGRLRAAFCQSRTTSTVRSMLTVFQRWRREFQRKYCHGLRSHRDEVARAASCECHRRSGSIFGLPQRDDVLVAWSEG
jgi:hypothetical protein